MVAAKLKVVESRGRIAEGVAEGQKQRDRHEKQAA
jgi:hypothetical protein